LSAIYCTPGPLNSILIKTENAVPNNPENSANIKYKTPISLAFVDKNHLSIQTDIDDLYGKGDDLASINLILRLWLIILLVIYGIINTYFYKNLLYLIKKKKKKIKYFK
jgi:hypothetical protein